MQHELVKSNIPKLTVCARGQMDKSVTGEQSKPHYHDELELLPIYIGELHCVVDGKDYAAKEGEVIFINSRIPHSTYATEPTKYGLLQFRETDFLDTEILKILKYSARLSHHASESVQILRIEGLFDVLGEILTEADRQDEAYDFYVRAGIFRILGMLYRAGVLSNAEQLWASKDVQRVVGALSYINSSYYEDITLEDISRRLGFDQSYFCRVFKVATGATFTEYLNFVRVCKAETLLARSKDSILEISEKVGFSSPSYFNRIFKKYHNVSPRHYRTARYIAISKGEKEY